MFCIPMTVSLKSRINDANQSSFYPNIRRLCRAYKRAAKRAPKPRTPALAYLMLAEAAELEELGEADELADEPEPESEV